MKVLKSWSNLVSRSWKWFDFAQDDPPDLVPESVTPTVRSNKLSALHSSPVQIHVLYIAALKSVCFISIDFDNSVHLGIDMLSY